MLSYHDGAAVVGVARELLDDLEPPASYRHPFELVLRNVERRAGREPVFLSIDVPLIVGELLGVPRDRRAVLGACGALLWGGADLLDDLADGDLQPEWEGVNHHQVVLVATNLLATLPYQLCQRLRAQGVPPNITAELSHQLSKTLWTMSVGQSRDLGAENEVRTHDEYLALVGDKTGAQVALYAGMPAVLAGCDDSEVKAWQAFGSAYGTMAQVFSDVAQLFGEEVSTDLMNGKRTEPYFCTLEGLETTEALTAFQTQCAAAARGDPNAAARARATMIEAGAVRYSLLVVELLRHRARRLFPARLDELPGPHPAHGLFRGFSLDAYQHPGNGEPEHIAGVEDNASQNRAY